MREREWSEIGEYYDGNMISNIYIYISFLLQTGKFRCIGAAFK